MNTSFYKEIIGKLELLIKKEYTALFFIGLLITLIIVVAVFTLLSLIELAANFKSVVRTILFFVFILAALGTVSYLILLPLLKYFNVFKKRDYFYSANKVGKYFPEIKDDLLNAMQLVSSDNNSSLYSTSLLDAAFRNVYERAKPIRFESIVDFTNVKKFSIYFLSVIMFCVLLFAIVPGL
ncbi:MAG: hypothetical protein Q8M94_03190, partial [Ignavibacteria bacterium]|nr:hypothetical protein [Ignavibacteria bacterium]